MSLQRLGTKEKSERDLRHASEPRRRLQGSEAKKIVTFAFSLDICSMIFYLLMNKIVQSNSFVL